MPAVKAEFSKSKVANNDEILFGDPETQSTLGVSWVVSDDTFKVRAKLSQRSFTKRTVLSVVNGVYDPIGIASPIVL